MIDRCKHLNITLGLCSAMNRSCPYMADPHSCALYEEEFEHPYQGYRNWINRIGTKLGGLDDKKALWFF